MIQMQLICHNLSACLRVLLGVQRVLNGPSPPIGPVPVGPRVPPPTGVSSGQLDNSMPSGCSTA